MNVVVDNVTTLSDGNDIRDCPQCLPQRPLVISVTQVILTAPEMLVTASSETTRSAPSDAVVATSSHVMGYIYTF